MENTKKPKIYESPDGGLTIYARDFSDYQSRQRLDSVEMHTEWPDDGWAASRPWGVNGDPVGTVQVKKNTYIVDNDLCDEHPELKAKSEEFTNLQAQNKASQLLNRK